MSGWIREGNAWRKDGWTHKFGVPARITPDYVDPRFPLSIERDMAFFDGRALTQVATREEVGPGKFFVDGAKRQLWIGDDPGGHVVEATVNDVGFNVQKVEAGDPTGSRVRGLGFCHFADQGMNWRVSGVVENSTFCWNGQRGLYAFDAADVTIRSNIIACNSRVGLRVSRARRLRVENNLLAWNNVDRWRTAWDAAGAKITNLAYGAADRPVIQNNRLEHNYSQALWLDIDANDALILRNTVRFNQGIGIFFEISTRAIIAFNVSQENGTGVMISNARNAQVWNNTLVRNGTNIVVKETNRANGGHGLGGQEGKVVAETPSGAKFTSTGNSFGNNILWGIRQGSSNASFNAGSTRFASNSMVVASDSNLFGRPDAAQPANLLMWSGEDKKPVGFAALEALRQGAGLERSSVVVEGASPFADEATGDFRLRVGGVVPQGKRITTVIREYGVFDRATGSSK